jgi:hypothetical protein
MNKSIPPTRGMACLPFGTCMHEPYTTTIQPEKSPSIPEVSALMICASISGLQSDISLQLKSKNQFCI